MPGKPQCCREFQSKGRAPNDFELTAAAHVAAKLKMPEAPSAPRCAARVLWRPFPSRAACRAHAATTSVVRLVSVKSPGVARLKALPQVLPCLRASSATRRCSGARLLRPLRGQRPKRTPHQGDATGEGLRKRTCSEHQLPAGGHAQRGWPPGKSSAPEL